MATAATSAGTKVKAAAPATAPAPAPTTSKSIVSDKYRDKYKNAPKDWFKTFIEGQATATRTVKVTKPNPTNPDEKITVDEQRPDGVDVKALFKLAKANGLNVDKYEAQVDDHGFPGRFRMTVGNMLRTVAKQRHGLFNKDGTFTSAPTDWLSTNGAGDKPSHDQKGVKIVPPKAETETKTADASKGAEASKKG